MNPTKLAILMQLMTGVLQLVVQAEKIITGPKKGSSRLALVTDTAVAATQHAPEVAAHFEDGDLRSAVRGIANAAVDGLNAAGVLSPKSIAATTQ